MPASASDAPLCVGLVGGESTGKSSLAVDVAAHLKALVVPEVLREFVERTGRTPTRSEQPGILREQIDRIDASLVRARNTGITVVIADPAPLMTAVYSMLYFDDDSLVPAALVHADRTFDLVLWCRPDLPWTADPGQRDGPAERGRADELLARLLPALRIEHSEVTGPGDARSRTALDAIAAERRGLA